MQKQWSTQSFLMMSGGIFLSVLTILAIVGIILAFLSTRSYQERNKTITVQGTGEVFVEPDIAEFSFTVREEADTVAEAQESVSETIEEIIEDLDELDVDERDIKTQSYSSNPRYEWRGGECDSRGRCDQPERVLVGYELQQSINVIVRDLEMSGDVLSLLGSANVDNLYGPNLRVEDTDEARNQAREEAIAKAQKEARQLAKTLGVRLGKMVDFWENNDGGFYPQPYAMAASADFAMEESAVMRSAPQIPTGENRVSSTIHLTFKIR